MSRKSSRCLNSKSRLNTLIYRTR
uniref:Uncharacterized protein n=1 Tax=Rhizophora mucronata TaxID=61149 RepID=A0A2P2PKB9_RHIMU